MITGIRVQGKADDEPIRGFVEETPADGGLSAGLDHLLLGLSAANPEDFRVLIHNKLAFLGEARRRRNSWLGRLVNRLTLQNPEVVALNGIELSALLAFAGETADLPVQRSARRIYLVPYDAVAAMYETFAQTLRSG